LNLVRVDRITARYDFSDLWRGAIRFRSVDLHGLVLTAAQGSDGRWIIPIPATGQDGGGEATPFAVGRLAIDSSRIVVLRSQDTLTLSDIDLVAAVERDGPSLSLNIQRLSFASSDSVLSLQNLSGRATLTGSMLLFQDLLIQKGQSRLKASGTFDVKSLAGDLNVSADGLALGDISTLFGGKLRGEIDADGKISFVGAKLRGRVNIGGKFLFADLGNLVMDFRFSDKVLDLDTVYGTIFGSCGIDGSGQVDFRTKPEQYRLSAGVRNLDLKQIVPGTFSSDLTGRMDLRGESFSNKTLVLEIDADLYESSFDEYPLQRAFGPLRITTDSLTFPTTFSVDYYENRFDVVGAINYKGEMHLEVDADLANLDRYRGRLFINQPGGRGRAHAMLSGRTSDPDLSGRFWSDSLWVYGLFTDSAYSEFDIKRFLRGRSGTVTVDLGTGSAWQAPFDSSFALLSLDSARVYIDTVAMSNSYAEITTQGLLDQGPYPWQLTLDTLTLSLLDRVYHNQSQIRLDIDSLGFNFIDATLAEGKTSISAERRVNFDETMDLNVRASGVAVQPWMRMIGRDYDVDGILSGEAVLQGSLASPVIDLDGSLDSIRFRGEELGQLTGSLRYRDSLVTIDSVVMTAEHGRYRADGQCYADLAFTSGVEKRLLDLPFNLKITGNESDTAFKLVPLLLPSVEQVGGEFHADFTLDGTPYRPHLDGLAYLKNGRLKYADLAEIIHTDSASVTLQDNKILINDINAYVEDENRKRSNVYLSGDLTVKAIDSFFYNVQVAIPQEFPFTYDLDDIGGVVMDTVYVKGMTPPTVTGDLTLVEGRYKAEFADEQSGSPLMIALSGENTWNLDINIEIPANYWIKNQDIDAEFSGFINIVRESGNYRFAGTLEILRGKGYLFDKTFNISPDSATVTFEDVEYFNPRLDIWATTRIPLARSSKNEQNYEDLKVHVTGTLEKPEFAFYLSGQEESEISYEAILPLIVANYYGETSTNGAFEERLSQLVSSQVSQIGTRQLGVETFEIDPTYEGYLDLARTRVTVGKYAGSNLYLWGRSSVEFQQLPEAGFEYRVSRALLLEGYRDEDINKGESYHLNLKMHWEYK
jgi:autotransporter translocation and assembly factor TamB